VSGLPIKEQLVDVWANTHKKGWINIEASNTLESLLHTAGPLWFVSNIIKVGLKFTVVGFYSNLTTILGDAELPIQRRVR
jgi:hypothetical protein